MGFLLVFPRVPLGRDLTVFPRFSSLLHNVYIEQTLNYTFPLTLSLYDQSLHHLNIQPDVFSHCVSTGTSTGLVDVT